MTGGKIVTKEVFVSRVEEMIPVLYRVCRAHFSLPQDREDAVQEALVRAWEKRDTLCDERYMQTWLIRILLNVCNGIHRKRRRAERAALPPPQPAPAGGADALREALMAFHNEACAGFKKIRDLAFVPALAHNANGKLIRGQFRDPKA